MQGDLKDNGASSKALVSFALKQYTQFRNQMRRIVLGTETTMDIWGMSLEDLSNFMLRPFMSKTEGVDITRMQLVITMSEWVSEWVSDIGCLTSQLTIFQSYMWRHIDVQADWRRSWTYGRAPNAIDIS